METFVIAGLGNPGPKYQWTRHNAGFLFLDRLAHLEGLSITRKQFGGLTAEWERKGMRLVLLKPQTFMNLSGRSIMPALQFYKLKPEQLIVVHDEIDLPLGTARLKQGGGMAVKTACARLWNNWDELILFVCDSASAARYRARSPTMS